MSVVGVDLSTHFVDLVKLNEDDDRAEWVRVPLAGENAIDRARSYRTQSPGEWKGERKGESLAWTRRLSVEWWDDVILCALEDPAGRGDTRKIARVQGVVIATIPARVQVWTMQPAEWRKACGLPGNCSKGVVREFVYRTYSYVFEKHLRDVGDWPQDACDAYAIAYAARSINQTQEEAA